MGEQLAQLEKKGGSFSETVLWSNANPSSSFNEQLVTLSDDMTNYKYIKFVCNGNTAGAYSLTYIIPTEDVINSVEPDQSKPIIEVGGLSSNGTTYIARKIEYRSATTIYIHKAFYMRTAGDDNTKAIPVKISGVY